MTVTTVSQLSAPVNRVLMSKFLRQAKPRCTYYAGAMPGRLEKHAGSFNVLWRRYDEFTPTTTPLSAISGALTLPTRSATAAALTNVTATIAKYGDHIFLNEEADLVNPRSQEGELIMVLAIQAGRSVNRLQRNVVDDNAALIYASNGSGDGDVADAITGGMIKNAVNVLDRNSAITFAEGSTGSQNIDTTTILAGFFLQCHSDVAVDISELDGFRDVSRYAGQVPTFPGEFGYYGVAGLGVRCISSPEGTVDADLGGNPGNVLRSTGGSAADLYTTVIYGREAHGGVGLAVDSPTTAYIAGDEISLFELINKPRGSAGVGDPFNEISSFAWKAWHAGAIVNPTWIRGLRTGANVLQ